MDVVALRRMLLRIALTALLTLPLFACALPAPALRLAPTRLGGYLHTEAGVAVYLDLRADHTCRLSITWGSGAGASTQLASPCSYTLSGNDLRLRFPDTATHYTGVFSGDALKLRLDDAPSSPLYPFHPATQADYQAACAALLGN